MALILIAALLLAPALLRTQTIELRPGTTFERGLSGQGAHEYQLALESGQYARLLLEQTSIDVAVECFGPDGKSRFAANSYFIGDTEIVELIADAPGAYRLRVSGADTHAPLGRYNIGIREIEVATERHRSRIAAARAFAQGSAYASSQSPSREGIRQAITNFEVALSHWQAARDMVQEAWTLLTIGQFYMEYADREKSLDYLTRGQSVAQASHDRRMEAWALVNLATFWNSFGDKRKAIDAADRALAIMRAVGDRAGEAYALNDLARGYAQSGEPRKGIGYFDQALEICRAMQDRPSMAALTGNLGTIYDSLGEYRLGLEHHQQALALNREIGKAGSEAINLNNIGSSYEDLGEYQKALDSYLAALDINRKLDSRRSVATNLHNIASVYDSLGDHQRALEFNRQALEIFRAASDQWSQGNTTNNIATIYAYLGDYTNAAKFYLEALALRRAANNVTGEAVTLNNLGKVYLKQGERQKALEYFEQALAIHRKAGQPILLIPTLQNLGTFYREAKNYERALPYLDEALEISRTISDRRNEALTLNILARLEFDRGDFAKAHERAGTAIAAFESVRAGVRNPTLRASFFASAREAQEVDIDALVRLQQVSAALQASERSRARSLLEMIGENSIEIRSGVDTALVAREQELEQLIFAKATRPPAKGDLDALRTELEHVQSRIRESSPQYAALTQPSPLDLKEIQAQVLDEDTVLLEYALGPQKGFLWAVTPSLIDVFELPGRSEIESAVKRLYDLVSVRQPGGPYADAAGKVSSILLSPAASRIRNKRLLIVGEGILLHLPFAALPDPAGTGPLIAGHEIITAPSASVVSVLRHEMAGRKPAAQNLAVLADPVFSANDTRITEARRSGAVRGQQEFVRLRFSRTEADEIARLAAPGTTLKALDFDASRETVLRPDFGQHRIVHFASHSIFNSQHPELSGVVLSLVDRTGRPQNGILRLYDIYNLRLASDLVVLSACQTALGEEIKGEGLIGLTRAFLYAGAPRVVATLWQIDDRTTAELMKHFYEAMLKGGEPPAAALRAAQIAVSKTKGLEAPYYWAAFTIQGEWR